MINEIKKAVMSNTPRHRDSRGFYASALTADARDLYWRGIGMPPTNPTDFHGYMRMGMGKWVEEGLKKYVLSRLHLYGYHLLGEEVPVGGSNPNVNGYLDALVSEGPSGKKRVIEIKTKSGYGADAFLTMDEFNPGDNYMAQLGYYLHDLSAKGVTNEGTFMFVLLSDKTFGKIVLVDCIYENGIITATRAVTSDGEERELSYTYDVLKALERLKQVEKCIEEKRLPPVDKQYKYAVTPELVEKLSDYMIRKVLNGEKILGDWEIRYSDYFDLHLEAQNATREYTEEELAIFAAEYKKRHPRSKLG